MHFINSAARAPKECCILLVLLLISQTEAFSWTQEPNQPTIVKEDGVNNKNVRLVWNFLLDAVEDLITVIIEREDLDGGNRVEIALRLKNTGFVYPGNTDFDKHYRAELPSQLLILDVDNVKEYKYILIIRFSRSGAPRSVASTVDVKVFAPPRITVPPARTSRVDPGQNLTLTCNASGDPTPNITWAREGATQANQLVNATGYRLYLVNVQKEDVGSYRCTASNEYGTVSSLSLVNVRCPSNQCNLFTVGITILGMEFKDAFRNKASVEYQQLASNVTSAITGPYSRPENAAKQLYEVAIEEFRNGSVIAVAQLQFQEGVNEPLQPLRDDMNDGRLGMFTVDRNLVLNPIPPRITLPPARTSRVDPGQNLTLTCNASGDPRPNITWTREGATQANQLVNATGYRLYLVNVQNEDVGSYRCTAINGYGIASSLSLVNVRCPSNQCDSFTVRITILGMEFNVALRNKASLEFQQLASNVTSAITGPYSRPENAAKQLYEVAIEEFRNGSVIAIAQLQFQKGANDPLQPLRDDMNDGRLGMFTVERNLVLNPTPPMITVWPKRRYKVDAGENLTLTCNSTGSPMPTISWTKEGVPQNQFYVSGHKLHLMDVKRKDVGSYRCTATNAYGTATSHTIVNLNCLSDQCQSQTVTISIPSVEWKESLKIRMSTEFETLESNLLSAIASFYTKFPQKELYELAIEEFRNGSTGVVAIVQLLFGDPLQPLLNGITDGKLGPLTVVSQLDINLSTTRRPATPSGDPALATPKTQTNSSPSDTGMTVIIGGCIALILATVM